MNELIKHDHQDFAGLVDLGSCTIHIVHNAFGKGMQQCGKEIEQLCMDLHSLFKYSAARRDNFKELQYEMDLEMHNFQQHTYRGTLAQYRTCYKKSSRAMGSYLSICQ